LGNFVEDVIQLADEPKPHGGQRLLKPVVLAGGVVPGSLPPLSEIWEFAQSNLRRFPDEFRQLTSPPPYPVHLSEAICRMREQAIAEQVGFPHPAERADGVAAKDSGDA
jgi:nicotinate phosphoribosyltransferase